jgi:general secretion pathway protein E
VWRNAAEGGTRLGPSPVVSVREHPEPAVVKAAEAIVDRAVRDGADGFIVAPDNRGVTIWHTKEGGAEEVSRLPRRVQLALTAQLKLMTGMNAESQALPQAGRCSMRCGDTEYVVRLRIHPSAYGERVLGTLEF